MTEARQRQLYGDKDDGTFEERLAIIESAYPAFKTAAFYDAIGQAGGSLPRPEQIPAPELEARTILDRAVGTWVVNGDFHEVFQALEKIAIDFEYGSLELPEEAARLGEKYYPLTDEQIKHHPLARAIQNVYGGLLDRAPEAISNHFSGIVDDTTFEQKLGIRLDRLRAGLKHRGKLGDNSSSRGGFGLQAAHFILLPLMYSAMSFIA